ncbi:MAG: histidine kinase [Rubrivivax sp.]
MGLTSTVAPPAAEAPAPGLELPGLVMRRAIGVAIAGLVLVLAFGLWRARTDTLREMQGSLDLARLSQVLGRFHEQPPEDGLRRLAAMPGLRHLQFTLRDERGVAVARIADEDADAWLVRRWRALSAALGATRPPPELSMPVALRDGRTWTAVLAPSPDSEILEAAANLAGLVALVLLGGAAMLAAMHVSVRRSLAPLRTLVGAIAGVERQQLTAVQALPAMPVRELEAIAQALRHLARAQQRSEAARQVLAHRLMSLQEDERQRLARDLHDEFGQRLTALRVDAHWLQRAGALGDEARRVVAGMAEQIGLIQDDVRQLLARLRPPGAAAEGGPGGDGGPQTLGRLRSMLAELVEGWSGSGREGRTTIELRVVARHDTQPLPPALVLGLYRLTQEALTNVMRHAGARHAVVELALPPGDDGTPRLAWRVADDGCGLGELAAAMRRGTGLAGLQERVWALGGQLHASTPAGGGTALGAEFRLDAASA